MAQTYQAEWDKFMVTKVTNATNSLSPQILEEARLHITRITYNGDLKRARQLFEITGDKFTSLNLNTACAAGNLELVKWMWENRVDGLTHKEVWTMYRLACETHPSRLSGGLETAQWIWNTLLYAPVHDYTIQLNIRYRVSLSDISIAKWLRETNQVRSLFQLLLNACAIGYLDMVTWIASLMPCITERTYANAFYVARRHPSVLRFLWGHCEANLKKRICVRSSLKFMVQSRHIDTYETYFDIDALNWLFSIRVLRSSVALDLIRFANRVEVAQWAWNTFRPNLCLEDFIAIEDGGMHCNPEVVRWASENIIPSVSDEEIMRIYQAMAYNPYYDLQQLSLSTLAWMRIHYPICRTVKLELCRMHLRTAQWMYSVSSSEQLLFTTDDILHKWTDWCYRFRNEVAIWMASLLSIEVFWSEEIQRYWESITGKWYVARHAAAGHFMSQIAPELAVAAAARRQQPGALMMAPH